MSSKKKTAATKEDGNPALVPKLRFPEFQDDWEMTPIGEKVDLLSGYPFDGPDICEDRSGVRLLRGINITEGRIRHSPEIDRYYTGETDGLEKFRVCLNDLVIGMDGSKVGKNSSLISDDDADALLIQRVARLRTSSPTLIQFIFQQINSTTFHSYVDKINTSSGIPHISAKQIKEFTVGFPSPPEQQKIAECLSSVDELMAAQARKVDALKTHKKGLMQQLFPREGETQPRLRFPEFQDAGEWEVKSVGDVFKVTRGEVLSMTLVKDETSSEAPYPVYSSQTKNKGLAGYYSEYLYQDAITWTTDGANAGDVNFRPGRFYCTNVCGVLINTDGQANVCIAALLNSVTRGHVSYVGNPKLMNGVMAKIEIPFPSIEEQQRIADCLTSLDALITAETQKLDALKTHKKGLMQQLFPCPEEIES